MILSRMMLKLCLQEYESIYKATRAVQSFPKQANSTVRRKRQEDSDDDDDLRYAVNPNESDCLANVFCRDEDRKRQLVEDDDEEAMEL